MDWSEYLTKSAETAIYKERFYPYLGLAGEAGEVLAEWGAADEGSDHTTILKELGDVCWYVAAITRDERLSVRLNWVQPGGPEPTHKSICALVIDVGRVMELVKKVNRDGEGVYTRENVEKLTNLLESILTRIHGIACSYGSSIEWVLQMNYDKLQSRKARGVLGGSGNNR